MVSKPAWIQAALAKAAEDAARRGSTIDFLENYLVELPVDVQEQHPMFDFQKEGIRFGLASQGRILLGDEMGLGKTRQALVIAASFKEEWPILVVVPSALRYLWRDQALLWLPNHVQASQIQIVETSKETPAQTAQIVIVSYNLLVRNEHIHLTAGGTPYKVLIGDESHFIKSVDAKRTKVFLDIARQASRCLLLSGTPLVNGAADVYTQIVALLPQHPPGHQEFVKRYCEKKVECYGGRWVTKWHGARKATIGELNSFLTSAIMIRRLKKDVLSQLPKKIRQRIVLASTTLDEDRMAEIARFMKADDNERRLKTTPTIMDCYKLTAEAKLCGVTEYVEHLLNNNIKFLIFGHHHVMLDAIEGKVKDIGAGYIRIDGSTPTERRHMDVAKFQVDEAIRVAILGITASSQGITLTAARTVIFAELSWVPGLMLQAEDRVHRIGQQEDVVDIHYCVAEGSIDDFIFASLNSKSKNTSAIQDGQAKHMDCYKKVNVPRMQDTASAPGTPAPAPKRAASQSPEPPPAPARRSRIDWSEPQEQQLREAIEAHGTTSGDCRSIFEDSRFPLLKPPAITIQQLTNKVKNMKKKQQLAA